MASSGEKKSGPILQWGPTEAALAKAGLNLIPFVGAFSELLTVFIPTQRNDRIEQYLHALGLLLDKMDEDEFKKKLETPEAIDLFEEGGFQTIRAISDERKGYIAQIVANGLAGDKIAQIISKRLLKLLAEIDDTQVIILSSKLNSNMFDDTFFEKHSSILIGPSVHMSSALSEVEAAALYEAGRSELLRLGLLKTNYSTPKKGELPSFDEKTETLKSQSSYLTTLGRMLLKNIGISEAEES